VHRLVKKSSFFVNFELFQGLITLVLLRIRIKKILGLSMDQGANLKPLNLDFNKLFFKQLESRISPDFFGHLTSKIFFADTKLTKFTFSVFKFRT
jgi:hypothetical protein